MSIVMRLRAAALFAISSTALSFSRSSSYWLNPPPPEVPAPPEEVPPNKFLRSLGILRAAMRFFTKKEEEEEEEKRPLPSLASGPVDANPKRRARVNPRSLAPGLNADVRFARDPRALLNGLAPGERERTEILNFPVKTRSFRVRKKGKVVACDVLGQARLN